MKQGTYRLLVLALSAASLWLGWQTLQLERKKAEGGGGGG